MFSKREVFIALIALFIGAFFMHFYSQNELNKNRQFTEALGGNCGAAMTAASKFIKNCNQTKNEVISCYSDLKSCNQKEFNIRMDELSKEANELDNSLKGYTKDLGELLNASK